MTKLAALVACSMLSLGCGELGNCPPDGDPVTVEGGITDTDALVYASSPIDGPRAKFPAKTYVHFVHDLGFTPETVNSYVSFFPAGSDASENAGNQGRIKCVDDHEIVINNDTCEDGFYIVVTASAALQQHAPCSCAERRDDGTCPND
jgi:hypothetical protein